MFDYLRLNLQLFGEGGDGGDGGSASPAGEGAAVVSGEEVPAHIPERAKKFYRAAVQKHKAAPVAETAQAATEPKETEGTQRVSYADLIKSDEYKGEHQAYMDRVMADRLKHFKGIEGKYDKAKSALDIVASKYGLDPESEDFLESITKRVEEDDSYFESYAVSHDISKEEARRVVGMERKLAAVEAQRKAQEQQERDRQQIMRLQQNAEKTKARFPEFDLATQMQDERFRRLCAVNNGDTTAAYMACNWERIIPATVKTATQQAAAQAVNNIAAGKSRPVEGAAGSSAPSVVQPDFRNMNRDQLRAQAAEWRKEKAQRR